MFDKFNLNLSKVFKEAEKEMRSLKHPYVGTEHLMLALLKKDEEIARISSNHGLTYNNFRNELIYVVGSSNKESLYILYTPLLKRVINAGIEDAHKDNIEINNKYLFKAIFDEGEGIAIRLLIDMGIDIDKLYDDIKIEPKKSINKNLEILNIGKNLENEINLNDRVIGREKEIELVIETLARKNKNNPLLVGDAGVGKTAIVEELSRRISKGKVPAFLKDKKIISLELGALVAGTKYRGEFEEKLNKIIKELEENPEIIVFIDEIHTIVNAGGAEGAINASDILKPYLARGKIKIIGATTTHEFNKHISKDKALARRFEVIKVLEPGYNETLNILSKVKNSYEKHYELKITNENIKDIVLLANKYVFDKKNPDKSLDILDSVCAMVSIKNDFSQDLYNIEREIEKLEEKKKKYIQKNLFSKATNTQEKIISLKEKTNNMNKANNSFEKNDILELLSKKCNIPLLENKEFLLKKITKNLNEKILGQDTAIKKILLNMKNYFNNEEKPLCLLLTGNTGVGKTETVKQIAKTMNTNLIRLDMSEYNLDISINRLIGAAAGYVGYNDEAVFNQIKMNPYSIILVDELEKASPAVMNLFLQIMDEGYVTNAQGEKLNFKNALIFMTSNVTGTQKIGFQKDAIDFNESFSKEFIARFDDIIHYKDIDKETVLNYLKKNNVTDLTLIEQINYEKYGLREAKKIIQKINVLN